MLERIGLYVNDLYHRYLEAGLIGAKIPIIEGTKGKERLELFVRGSFQWTLLELGDSVLLMPDQSIIWQYDQKGKLRHCLGVDQFSESQRQSPPKPVTRIEVIEVSPIPILKKGILAA